MKGKILIVDDLHPIFKERAAAMGYDVHDRPLITRAETLAIIADYEGIAVRTKFLIDKELMEAAPNLKFIARAGAGLDNIDEAFAKLKGIKLLNAPEGNMDAVGEHAIGMLLALMNNFRNADTEVRKGVWDREGNRGYELKGKTVGIIGYGFMGKSFAKKLSGFDVHVIAYDKYKTGFSDAYAREVSMEEIVKQSDVLSLHIPLTPETRQMVNEEYLFHFRKPLFFINTARGEVVSTEAVLKAIAQGKILGAGLDVLEVEKFPALSNQEWYNALKLAEKVVLTPHVGGWTFDSYRKISEVLAEKLKDI
ncbi:2-hydroxyacid dehydrogenase [Pedobacter heparinus]|uniref:D-isomer specific 2-hydroxyacid dehydrogenase NAD-binding n=1 Tax=Pedobacter heparinus (strain ATCC 13125 / DSM 2366 / CIP 104194 / JCM 7457 / NBRC 12017 / NCIMB 9290 / NRRL B-14731 / HIM 762-3) TaxID=485917 RepID=C6XUZ4_PEDHD|nr:2-hydroxyacid dehydrogenase [Pedobacter heparinus]ACU06002.1 D-isomer specific 2-hydroxyacid dehydrogenase NAD-binding [Pedobacter heparinus DSM 2366]